MNDVIRFSMAMGLACVGACASGPSLVLLSGQDSSSEVPAGCAVVGVYSAADLDDGCARLTGRVALCGGAITTESYGCYRDQAGQLWFGSPGLDDSLWETVGWEPCSAEEVALVGDFDTCAAP